MGMGNIEESNAIIKSTSLSIERGGLLTAYIHLDYGGSGQGFGGYSLYLDSNFKHHDGQKNFAGHFIFRCLKIAGVEKWDNLVGKTVRARHEHSKVHAIGHIVKDDWFNPSEEFEELT